jgi:2,3-bisphosphoglycerate-dependent phosphoglycerate mutase
MKLFIIRHAQSANNFLAESNAYDEYMERRDPEPPLTELGHQQAKLLASHLAGNNYPERKQEGGVKGYGLTRLYCSPMMRTLQTAWPISQHTGLKSEIWLDLHEQGGIFHGNPRNSGSIVGFPGLNRRQIEEQYPGYVVPDALSDKGWWTGGYEDMQGCRDRASRVAQTLRQWAPEMPDERIALVSHGTFAEALVRALLELPADHRSYYSHYNTAITRLDFLPDGYLFVRYLNRIQHLPPELISR